MQRNFVSIERKRQKRSVLTYSPCQTAKMSACFTLIELLIVIAIIAILGGKVPLPCNGMCVGGKVPPPDNGMCVVTAFLLLIPLGSSAFLSPRFRSA